MPTAICTHPTINHTFECEDFDLPTVGTWTVVEGVERYDPELGGQPLETEEIPPPIALTYTGEQKPPAKKAAKKRGKKAAKRSGKKAVRGSGKRTARKATGGGERATG